MIASSKRSIIGYSELSLFSVYLTDYDLWRKFEKADSVFLLDGGWFENALRKSKKEFKKRQEVFGCRNLLDAIDDTMVRSLVMRDSPLSNADILSYISCQGRLYCLSAMTKRTIALKLKSHMKDYVRGKGDFLGTYALGDGLMPVLSRTAFYFGVASYDDATVMEYCENAYARLLSTLQDNGLEKMYDEAVVLLVNHTTHCVVCMVRKIVQEDCVVASSRGHVNQVGRSLFEQRVGVSEWDVVRAELGRRR